MPHFRFRALERETVQILSKSLVDELQPVMDCSREDFSFELIATTFFSEGEVSLAYPFIEVLWFDRGQEKQDICAKAITAQVRKCLGKELDVAVVFIALSPSQYYDNGEHY